ncbi:MAG: hypothetical protein M3Z26_06690 [Bacteroidota bacterium]|nr:hypothetical protein [Bacteroidota bacterium]
MILQKNINLVNNISQFLLVLLFVYTGFSKLLQHELFLNQINQIAILKKIAPLISVSLPMLEIATGLLIAFNRKQILGWWLASVLMASFTIYVSVMLLSKSSLPCTCGGVIASLTWKQHLLFNIFFMLMSWFVLYNYYKERNENISTNKRK